MKAQSIHATNSIFQHAEDWNPDESPKRIERYQGLIAHQATKLHSPTVQFFSDTPPPSRIIHAA